MTEASSNAKKQYRKRELADHDWQPLELGNCSCNADSSKVHERQDVHPMRIE